MNIKVIVMMMTLLVLGAAVLTAVFDQPPSTPKPNIFSPGSGGTAPHDPPPGDNDGCSPSPSQSPGE